MSNDEQNKTPTASARLEFAGSVQLEKAIEHIRRMAYIDGIGELASAIFFDFLDHGVPSDPVDRVAELQGDLIKRAQVGQDAPSRNATEQKAPGVFERPVAHWLMFFLEEIRRMPESKHAERQTALDELIAAVERSTITNEQIESRKTLDRG